MADQRSRFRFSVPRLKPSVPPPRPTTTPTQTTPRRPPIRPQPALAPTRPQSTTPPPPLPQAPARTPTLPVAPAPAQAPIASPPVPPSLPPPRTVQNQSLGTVPDSLPEQPVEPSLALPDTPLQPNIQSSVSSQPPLPSHVSTRTHASVTPPSPSTTSPPTTPRLHTSQPPYPPTSPSHLTSQPAKIPTSPIETATKVQPKESNTDTDTPNAMNKVEGEMNTTAQNNKTRHQESSSELSSEESNSETCFKQQPQILHEHQNHISTTGNFHNESYPKSTTLHSEDNVPVPESTEKAKPSTAQASYCEETTGNSSEFVISFTGSNRGTSMRIGSGATKRVKSIHILRKYKTNPDESDEETTTDGEESSNEKKMEDDKKDNENLEKNAYVINCNIQGINNSMVVNCSFTERNPGVYLGSSSIPEYVMKLKRKFRKSIDRNKVKVNINPSQKHTIRRRCLRGLFMDSSDSDSNDPQKPRRHGCRYMSGEKSNKDDKMNAS